MNNTQSLVSKESQVQRVASVLFRHKEQLSPPSLPPHGSEGFDDTVEMIYCQRQLFEQISSFLKLLTSMYENKQRRNKLDGWGKEIIFVYSCSQTIKTIDFKRN